MGCGRKVAVGLVWLGLSACGQGGISLQKQNGSTDPRLSSGIDPKLQPHVELFERLHQARVIDIPVNFKTIATAGECRTYRDGYREIFIDPSIADVVRTPEGQPLPEEQRQKLFEEAVLHELGHCVLNRKHEEARLLVPETGETVPRSIMHPHYFGHQSFYSTYHDYYLKELFQPKNTEEITLSAPPSAAP